MPVRTIVNRGTVMFGTNTEETVLFARRFDVTPTVTASARGGTIFGPNSGFNVSVYVTDVTNVSATLKISGMPDNSGTEYVDYHAIQAPSR